MRLKCLMEQNVEERGFLVSLTLVFTSLMVGSVALTLAWLIHVIDMFYRPCLRMSVGLVLGTGDGLLFRETNSVSGSIPMKKQERSVV